MMSVVILGLGALLYPVIVIVQTHTLGYIFLGFEFPLWVAGFLCWVLVRLGWFLVWRGQVVHTKQRRNQASALTFVTFGIALILWMLLSKVLKAGSEDTAILASTVAAMVSLMGTILLYFDKPLDRATRASAAKAIEVKCPNCDYNLAGLTATRCPECGKEYTLEALLAAQAAPAGQDVS